MDYEPAYGTVDCVAGIVESAQGNNSTFPLPLLLLLRCCVPKLSMCPSITGFPSMYVGIFYVGDMNIYICIYKKTTEKNGVRFAVSFFGGNKKTTLKKSVSVAQKR